MRLIKQCNELARSGQVEAAFNRLSKAVAEGESAAAIELAKWRVSGDYIRRDLNEARKLFQAAADLGSDAARGPLMSLMGHGAGQDRRRWREALEELERLSAKDALAAEQLALLVEMDLDAEGNPKRTFDPSFLSNDPLIVAFPEFLTPAECEMLRKIAEPLLSPALVVHPSSGKLIADPIRNSSTAAFPLLSEDPFLHAINRRIAAASRSRAEQGEPTQILRYRPGQEYKLHSDAISGEANQRIQTFLVALNSDFTGGETYFPSVELRLRYGEGDAVCFSNVNQDLSPSRTAFHAGLPVTTGQKYLLSKWIRQRPLDLTGPSNRPY